ncbi:FAD-dependent monooxygenase [Chitinophaga vietnamensis]|uniref:FAD-dependent monooxygenase n=1 Tax=Chitinophaga vietnamensis TaxID=2593957 RepID=UPI001177E375|nr:FAD-dependent monooxygenase [Chitinophaga vietnamensis]
MNTSNILIIGGGIGGLALALFLHKAGIPAAIYEAYAWKDGVGGGLNIAPNGMNVLATLGLAEEIKKRGALTTEHCFQNEKGKVLARMSNGNIQRYGQFGVSITRSALHEVLTIAVNKAGIPIHYNKRLQNIRQQPDSVTAFFEDGTETSGSLLIGADGIHSATRRIIWPDGPKPAFTGMLGVGGFVKLANVPSLSQRDLASLHYVFGAKGFFGYSPADKDYAMWWSNLPSPTAMSAEVLQDTSVENVKREMLAIYKDYENPVVALIAHSEKVLKQNISDIPSLPVWHQQRVLLMGDAAHAVSPNAGQGASMALEDAICLARLLRDIPGDHEKVFGLFEAARKPRVERIVAEGRRRGDDKKIVTPMQAKIRNFMISVFIRLFGSTSQDWLYRYKINWEEKVAA